MRLRPLTEAECYARCYGGRMEERVSFVRLLGNTDGRPAADRLAELFDGGSALEREPEAA